jgi:hypothetical protein
MKKEVRRTTTLLDLVETVQDHTRSDAEVVAVIAHMIDTGRLVLKGNFSGSIADALIA